MNINWYFSDDLSPSDELVDKFADSKFGIDRWNSFAREIIQNSLDAQDDINKPVEVEFDLNKTLTLNDIPGGERTKSILEKCKEVATNKQTQGSYKVGLDVLNKEYVYCLKISDKNTKGVKTGRNEAWGAFVFDEGKSVKQRPGSAGSHGVGKKVPFIISSCNTVFYATKNKYTENNVDKSDCLLQGKTALISWTDDDGIRKNSKGWYGYIDENADQKNKIKPIIADKIESIHPYFKRVEEYGTDVIIVGVNLYNNETEVKKYIISAVLENFFVAIIKKKLVVTVFGEKIDASNFSSVYRKYYTPQKETKNSLAGCLQVFGNGENPDKKFDINDDKGNYLGSIEIFFDLGNEYNRKYYTVVREHGMRITDYRINKAGQPYTAVVYVEGTSLNALLSSLENAAHDDFVTKDENMDIDKNAVNALYLLQEKVKEYIYNATNIDDREGQSLDGLNNIITIPGTIATIAKKKNKVPNIKKSKVKKKGKGTVGEGETRGTLGTRTDKKTDKKRKKVSVISKEGDFQSILFDDFYANPVFIKTEYEYLLKFGVNEDLKNADLIIKSVNSENKEDNTIADYIDYIVIDNKEYNAHKGVIHNIVLEKEKIYSVKVKLKKDITYQLSFELYKKGVIDNE